MRQKSENNLMKTLPEHLLQAKTFQEYVKLNFDGPNALKQPENSKKVSKVKKDDSQCLIPNFAETELA